MACITVLVGQCGNQLGSDFLIAIAEAAACSSDAAFQHRVSSTFFRRDHRRQPAEKKPIARCVLIDMEPQAVADCQQRVENSGYFRFFHDHVVTKNEGSGNNWAFGYYGQGESKRDAIYAAVSHEVEHADAVAAFHVVHSVAGGTGSGVGSLVSDLLREHWPRVPLLHSVVWPFARGEVLTQWLNAVLCLKVLDENVDGILLLCNDDALKGTEGNLTGNDKARPSVRSHAFRTINRVFSIQQAMLVLPQQRLEVPTPRGSHSHVKFGQTIPDESALVSSHTCLHDCVTALSSNSRRKFFDATMCPTPSTSADRKTTLCGAGGSDSAWRTAVANVLRDARLVGPESALLALRGHGATTIGHDCVASALNRHDVPLNGLHVDENNVSAELAEPVAVCFRNADSLGARVAFCAEQVERYLAEGAYVHHYERYGVDRDTFEDAVVQCWSVASAYGC